MSGIAKEMAQVIENLRWMEWYNAGGTEEDRELLIQALRYGPITDQMIEGEPGGQSTESVLPKEPS